MKGKGGSGARSHDQLSRGDAIWNSERPRIRRSASQAAS